MRVDNQSTRNARAERNIYERHERKITQEQVRDLLEAAQAYCGKKPSPDDNTITPYVQRLSQWKHRGVCPATLRTNFDTGELYTTGECDCTIGKLITAIEAITGKWA